MIRQHHLHLRCFLCSLSFGLTAYWLEFASHLLCSRESLPVVPYNNLLGGDATKVFSTIGKDVKIKHFHTYVTNI